MLIELNRNPSGRISNIVFGLASVIDGFIRIISFGYLHTRLPITVSKYQAKYSIQKSNR